MDIIMKNIMDTSWMMNNFTNWYANIGLLAVLAISFMFWYVSYKYSYWTRKGIKSPPAIPFLGNLLSPNRPIPLMQMDHLKQYGKFFGLYSGRKPVLSVADPIVIKRILVQDFHLFRNRVNTPQRHKILSQNLVAIRDEKWKRIRSICSPMFTSSKLKKMEYLMGQCIESLMLALDKIADNNGTFFVHGVMGNFTMDVIAKCAFATETDAHNEKDNPFVKNAQGFFRFRLLRNIILAIMPGFLQTLSFKIKLPYIYLKEIDFFTNTSFYLINKRRQNVNNSPQDMLQLMVQAEHDTEQIMSNVDDDDMFDAHHVNVGKEELEQEKKILKDIIGSKYLNEEEIAAQAMIFFLAGYETTASTLTFCMYELATHPDIQEKLYQEIQQTIVEQGKELNYNNVMKLPYLDAILSETLRKHPPALLLSREASEQYSIPEYNYTMNKGDGIFIPVYSIHHNPEFYPEPEIFNPERFMPENRHNIIPYTYLPFGGGPRNCIGMRFALSEAKLGLANIINKFTLFKSSKTCDNLLVEKSLFLLKTTPIYVGVKHRVKDN